MSYKVAIASNDGKTVNQHFGTADKFYVYEVNHREPKYMDIRDNIPYCIGNVHDAQGVNKTVELLLDCKYVLVSKIGLGPALALQDKGIEAVETDQQIYDALKYIIGITKEDNK